MSGGFSLGLLSILLYLAWGHEEETARSLEDRIKINMLEQQSTKSREKFSKDFCSVLPF